MKSVLSTRIRAASASGSEATRSNPSHALMLTCASGDSERESKEVTRAKSSEESSETTSMAVDSVELLELEEASTAAVDTGDDALDRF